MYQENLIVNGQFSSGNSGFTSSLNYVTGFFCPLCPEDTYTIGSNATFYHSGFSGTDHTNPPFGNFMIANGPGEAGSLVWCESFSVQPNVDYTFTFWARDVANNNDVHPYALLQPSFNGVIVDDTLVADGGWEMFSMVWNSGSATYLDLCLVNQQSNTGGNDFGLDDISLTTCRNYELSQEADAGPDQSVCSNLPVMIGQTSLNGYTYSWDNPIGLNSTTISSPTAQMSNGGAISFDRTYILTTDSAGVGCVTTDTVVVTFLPMPEFSLGEDLSICPGETATLDAGSGWDNVLWFDGSENQTLVTTEGEISAEVSYGICDAADTVIINLVPMPVVDLGNDIEFCEGDTITLYSGIEGEWSDGSIADSLEVTEGNEYWFQFINGMCFESDTIQINMINLPQVTVTPDTSFCQGTELVLSASASGLWNTGDIGTSITIDEGGYYDIVVANGICTKSAGTTVEMNPTPFVPNFTDESICEDDSLFLDAGHDHNSYFMWSDGDTISTNYIFGQGYYSVEVGNQCDTVEKEFYIDTYPCSWAIYIPSSFTPNDDNINEGWMVKGYNVSEVKIYVYNRFGDMIFFANDLEKPWNPGTGIGDDVYNYLVTATTFNGESFEEKGRLYLLR